MKLNSTVALLFLLFATSLVAQPRVFEERSLSQAVRDAELLVAEGRYERAMASLEPAIDSARAGDYLADALHLQAAGNVMLKRYHSARLACNRFLADYASDARACALRYLAGIAAYNDGDTTAAIVDFTASVNEPCTSRSDALYWLARINAQRGRLDTARVQALASLAAAAREDQPAFERDATYLIAWIDEAQAQPDSAALRYRAIADGPANDFQLDARLRLGVIDARRGYYESAIRLLNSLTPRTDRQREEQLFYLGEMSSALARYDEALHYNSDFVREFPTSRRIRHVRYGIGWAQLKMERYDEAIATFRALEPGIDSLAAASAYQIGAVQILRGDTTGAVRQFEALLARLPYESFSDNSYYQLGRIFYRRRDYDSARHYLLVTARQFPESDVRADAYYLLGESYAAMGDAANAQLAFARVRRTGATAELAGRSLYREGMMLYRVGRFRSAIDRFRQYAAEHGREPDADDATFWLGEALYQDRTYDEAERYYGAYLEKASMGRWREQSLYGLAWARLQQKDFKGAAVAFSDFIAKGKNSPLATEATIRLADCYRLMGDYDKAIATYQSVGGAAGKGARDEEARFRIAGVFLQTGDVDRAVDVFRSLINDYPASPLRDAYAFNIGSIYHEKGRDSLAIAELERFGAAYPSSQFLPQAVFTIGDAFYNREQYDSALVYYRRVLDEYPNSTMVPEALDAVRFTLNAANRGAEAVAIIDSFQVRNPSRIPTDSLNFRKANIVLEQGNFADAIGRFTKLLDEFPQSTLAPEAVFGIGRAHEYMNHQDTALVFYGRVIERYPESAAAERALVESGGLRLGAGAWPAAAEDYERFVARYPESERVNEAHYGLARARLELHDTAAAMTHLKAVLQHGRDTSAEDLPLDKSRIAYARLIAARGGTDEAMELLAAVVARRLDDVAAEALLVRGELLFATKDYSGSLAELRRLATDFASFPEYVEPGLLLTGSIHEQLTNYAAARDVYTQLATTSEHAAVKAEAQARLKRLKR